MIRDFSGKTPLVADSAFVSEASYVVGDVEIDDFCMIGAGSILTPGTRVPSMSYVLGIPGQVKGRLSGEQIARLKEAASTYAQLAQKYRQSGL